MATLGVLATTRVALAGSAASSVSSGTEPRDASDGPPLWFGSRKRTRVGAYGGVGSAYTRFLHRDSTLLSVEAALLFNHRLSLGLAAYGFARLPESPEADTGRLHRFGAGYGGFVVRYSVFTQSPVYLTFGALLGAGAVKLSPDCACGDSISWRDGRDEREWRIGNYDAFVVAQPEVALDTNVTRWLRVGVNVGYRLSGGVHRFGLGASDVNGVVAGGKVQLGWF